MAAQPTNFPLGAIAASVSVGAGGITCAGNIQAGTVDINGGAIDATTIGGSTPAAGTFSALTVGADGLDVTPGSDIDADLLTVGVTGSPKLWWDESADSFALTHALTISGNIQALGTIFLGSGASGVAFLAAENAPTASRIAAYGSTHATLADSVIVSSDNTLIKTGSGTLLVDIDSSSVVFSKVINVSAGKIDSGTPLPASFADLAAVRTFLATAFA
jgi:hypothetical protein